MASAVSALVGDTLTRAGSLISDFGAILALVGGIAVVMWILTWLRGFVGGGGS